MVGPMLRTSCMQVREQGVAWGTGQHLSGRGAYGLYLVRLLLEPTQLANTVCPGALPILYVLWVVHHNNDGV